MRTWTREDGDENPDINGAAFLDEYHGWPKCGVKQPRAASRIVKFLVEVSTRKKTIN